jgi:hypothetical protein
VTLLTIGVAVLDELTRLTCLEANTLSSHTAAIGAADDDLVHPKIMVQWSSSFSPNNNSKNVFM